MTSAMSSLRVPPLGATLIEQKQQSPHQSGSLISMEGTSFGTRESTRQMLLK